MKRIRFTALLRILAIFFLSSCVAVTPEKKKEVELSPQPLESRIIVDTRSRELTVMRGDEVLARFDHLALGSSGAALKTRRNDDVTPLGEFTVGWINLHSKFTAFIGLNYPSAEYAAAALHDGRISAGTFAKISDALRRGKVPPQNTALGGYIGIHGIGRGSIAIHRLVDWTDGCVALTNQQIRELIPLVRIGMNVLIK